MVSSLDGLEAVIGRDQNQSIVLLCKSQRNIGIGERQRLKGLFAHKGRFKVTLII